MKSSEMYLLALEADADEYLEGALDIIHEDWRCCFGLGELIDEIEQFSLDPLMERTKTIEAWVEDVENDDFVDSVYEPYWKASCAAADAVLEVLDRMMSEHDDPEGFREYNYTLEDALEEYEDEFKANFTRHYPRLVDMARLIPNHCEDEPFYIKLMQISDAHLAKALDEIRQLLAA